MVGEAFHSKVELRALRFVEDDASYVGALSEPAASRAARFMALDSRCPK